MFHHFLILPSSRLEALLEVLVLAFVPLITDTGRSRSHRSVAEDPEQNSSYRDHYLVRLPSFSTACPGLQMFLLREDER